MQVNDEKRNWTDYKEIIESLSRDGRCLPYVKSEDQIRHYLLAMGNDRYTVLRGFGKGSQWYGYVYPQPVRFERILQDECLAPIKETKAQIASFQETLAKDLSLSGEDVPRRKMHLPNAIRYHEQVVERLENVQEAMMRFHEPFSIGKDIEEVT